MSIMNSVITLGILFLFKICDSLRSEPQHGYMTHFYFGRKPIIVNDSMVLELTSRMLPTTPDRDYLTCDVDVMTSPGRRIQIHFLSLEITDKDRAIDRLHIYDYNAAGKQVRLSPAQGLYGLYDKQYQGRGVRMDDYISTGHTIKLDYQGRPTLAYDGFKILITSFRDAHGDCGRNFVRCSAGFMCIPVSTWCDGYNNCGADDNSDEEHCNHGNAQTWQPIDGQVTAVVTTAVSCTIFLITAVVISFVIMKINKREIIHHNTTISVGFRKRKAKKPAETRDQLTRLYAPPSYEVVIGMDESPPPYQSDEYDSDTDTESDIIAHVTGSDANACAANTEVDNTQINVTSALVERDMDGQEVCRVDHGICDPSDSNVGFQDLNKYRLCGATPGEQSPNTNTRKTPRLRGAIDLDEIEVLSSEEEPHNDQNKNISKSNDRHRDKHANVQLTGGNVGKHNGAANGKCNGHSVVTYNRTPSNNEGASIQSADHV